MTQFDELYEVLCVYTEFIDEYNAQLDTLDEAKRRECIVSYYDGNKLIRKKCAKAKSYGIYAAPLWHAVHDEPGDDDAPETPGEISEAMSATERTRRYYRRHPKKVRAYLKKTQKDRVARNRDRRKAIRKHGKAKMKNHDVHHPKGPHGGSWRLAKKDHGPDKKKKNESVIVEGGAAGHMQHPYENLDLSFGDLSTMINRALVGDMEKEGPVIEKMDGQNISFTVKDGKVLFARNKTHVKNRGERALTSQQLTDMFAGRGHISNAFSLAATDIESAVKSMSPEELQKVFNDGSSFMSTEIIYPNTRNVIPYDKTVLVFHGTNEYDEDGEKIGQNVNSGKIASDAVTRNNAQKQKTFGISGPRTVAISNKITNDLKKTNREIQSTLVKLRSEYGLRNQQSIRDYMRKWWNRQIDSIESRTGLSFSHQERKGLISRWVDGNKKFGVRDIGEEKRKWFREFEKNELEKLSKLAISPIEKAFLKTGAHSLKRVAEFLSANNPGIADKLKTEFASAIESIKKSAPGTKLDKLQYEMTRLKDIGVDKIVPTEGLIFTYNGNPYKLTGAFAPINQIMGVMRFSNVKEDPSPSTDTETPASASDQSPTSAASASAEPKSPIAIYPGRFQPYHAGHQVTYNALVDKFGQDNVYVVSSNVQDSQKSPFSFADKKAIMTKMFGIPDTHVIQVKNPYAPTEILSKFDEATPVVFAVGEKDASRLGGNYFAKYGETDSMEGYKTKGYVWIGPPPKIEVNGKEISGTQLRSIFGNPKVTDRAKQEIFIKTYGKFDKSIFSKVVKITSDAEEAAHLTKTYTKPADKPGTPEPTSQPASAAQEKPSVDKALIGPLLKQRIRNPKTNADILVGTALKYPKAEPVHRAAVQFIKQSIARGNNVQRAK